MRGEALKEIKTASEIQPSNPNYLINLGTKYEDVNDKKSAKEAFERALKIDPDYIPAMYRLGTLEAEEGNTQRAKEIFEKAIKRKA